MSLAGTGEAVVALRSASGPERALSLSDVRPRMTREMLRREDDTEKRGRPCAKSGTRQSDAGNVEWGKTRDGFFLCLLSGELPLGVLA